MTDPLFERSHTALQRYASLREMQKKGQEATAKTHKRLDVLTGELSALERAGAFLRVVSDYSRRKSIGRIEDTINAGLLQIFDPRHIQLKIEFDTKSSRVNANVYLTGDNGDLEDVMDGRGGGVRDIVSVLLRVMFKKMVHPPLGGPIVLDESLRFLNSIDNENGYVVKTYQFLKSVAKKFDQQMIIVTSADSVVRHGRAMDAIDRMFMVKLVDGVSKATMTYDADSDEAYG